MDNVARLSFSEMVVLETDRLLALIRMYGPQAGEDIICRAMEDLATRLSRCETAQRSGDIPALRQDLRALRDLAEQLGMSLLSRAADQAHECLSANDAVALNATLARMIRVADRSLYAVWDIEGLSV